MSVQETYSENLRAGLPGMQADMRPATIVSRNVEDEAGIGFGLAVFRGDDDQGCSATGTSFLGITMRDRSVRPETPNLFAQYESARIMQEGPIFVQASLAVDAGDPVYVTAAGAWTNVATDNTEIPNAVFDSSTSGAGLAKIFLA